MNKAWRDIPVGTIIDEDIANLATSGELIIDGFDQKMIKQACYELRASDIFYDTLSSAENKRTVVGTGEGYLLKPNTSVVCIVREQLRLPANVLGRILTKGRLFSVGILPVNTYADPGFEGRLGITLYNASRRYLMICPGEAIAKIEFSILAKDVAHPYAGQHGYETEIWPIASNLFVDPLDQRFSSKVGTAEEELALSYGPLIAELSRQVRFYRFGVWVQLFAVIIGFIILFAIHKYVSIALSLALGVAANLFTTLLVNVFADRRKHG